MAMYLSGSAIKIQMKPQAGCLHHKNTPDDIVEHYHVISIVVNSVCYQDCGAGILPADFVFVL